LPLIPSLHKKTITLKKKSPEMRFVFKNCMKKNKKIACTISFYFSGILIYFCFFRSKSGLHQYFWKINILFVLLQIIVFGFFCPILLSVLRFTDSDFPFGIFKLFFYSQILKLPKVLLTVISAALMPSSIYKRSKRNKILNNFTICQNRKQISFLMTFF
jgi:hypothetical protein